MITAPGRGGGAGDIIGDIDDTGNNNNDDNNNDDDDIHARDR